MKKIIAMGLFACVFTLTPANHSNNIPINALADEVTSYENFIYVSTFSQSSTDSGFTFGKSDNLYKFALSYTDRTVELSQKDKVIISTKLDGFSTTKAHTLSLVVNDDTTRLYVDDAKAAVITTRLYDYDDAGTPTAYGSHSNDSLTVTEVTDGKFNCGNLYVEKIINTTDNNYRLSQREYSVEDGKVTIKRDYLDTLYGDTDYKFRVYTPLTDLSFVIHNDIDGGVSASMVEESITRGDDLHFTLDQDVIVKNVKIDGKDVDVSKTGENVTIAAENLKNIEAGDHLITVYTNKGRPEIKFTLEEVYENDDIVAVASHVFFYIDMAIFATLILGYFALSTYKKLKTGGSK